MKMRAAVLTATQTPKPYATSKPVEVAEIDLDPPGEGEVLVEMKAAGVCHSDLSIINGSRPRPTPLTRTRTDRTPLSMAFSAAFSAASWPANGDFLRLPL